MLRGSDDAFGLTRSGKAPDPAASDAVDTAAMRDPEPKPALRQRPRPAEDPFAPVGLRLGAFLLYPSVELGVGATTNLRRSAGSGGGWLSDVSPELLLRSDWSRHALEIRLRGAFDHDGDGEPVAGPQIEALLRGRIDIRRDTVLELGAEYRHGRETAFDPDLPVEALQRPITRTSSLAATLSHRLNRVTIGVTGSVAGHRSGDVETATGEIFAGDAQDYTEIGWRLRSGYELSPAVQPFVAAFGNRRIYEGSADSTGSLRGSGGLGAETGVRLELTGKLTGEAALGYQVQHYPEPDREDVAGLVGRASLVWAATGLTKLSLEAATVFEETTLEGSSGAISRRAGITVEHAFRRWLLANISLALERDRYEGIERTDTLFEATAGLEYKLSRVISFKGAYAFEKLRSSVSGEDYTANIVRVGLRLQR